MSSTIERAMGKENPTSFFGVKSIRSTPKQKSMANAAQSTGQENGMPIPFSHKKLTELKPVKRALGDVSNTRMFASISNLPKVSPAKKSAPKQSLSISASEKKTAKKSRSPQVIDSLPEPEVMPYIEPINEDNSNDLWPLNTGFDCKDMFKLVNFWERCQPACQESPSSLHFKVHEDEEVTSLDLLSPIIQMDDISSMEDIGDW